MLNSRKSSKQPIQIVNHPSQTTTITLIAIIDTIKNNPTVEILIKNISNLMSSTKTHNSLNSTTNQLKITHQLLKLLQIRTRCLVITSSLATLVINQAILPQCVPRILKIIQHNKLLLLIQGHKMQISKINQTTIKIKLKRLNPHNQQLKPKDSPNLVILLVTAVVKKVKKFKIS